MLIEGRFTFVAKALNMSGGILFLTGALHFYIQYRKSEEKEYLIFTMLCILFGMAGLLFEHSQLWDASWWWWHVLRLAAYMIVLSYLFVAYKRFEDSMRKTNEILQGEIIERQMIEEEMERVNNSLETRISERTIELTRNNRQLHLEIEERISVQEELSVFKNLINQSNDAIYVIDPETSRFLDFNEKAIADSGYQREELATMGVVDIETELSEISLWRQLVNDTKAKRGQFFQGKLKTKDGMKLPVEVSYKYITQEKSDYIIAIVRDITERKHMEELLLHAEKLKSIGIMTSGITHEFNNILAIIKGFTLLLEEKYSDHKEVHDKLHIILNSTNDGINIVNRMQEFTRKEQEEISFEPINIEEIIEQVIKFTKPRWTSTAQAKGIKYYVEKRYMKTVPTVRGNGMKLREVILNIFNNALDSMPNGGRISFHIWKNKDNVALSISDTGEGMSKVAQKHIFDPFFSTRKPKRAGLGMSVSYGIIMNHGGNIEVESEVGKGTIITILLPIFKDTRYRDTKLKLKQRLDASNLNILIVDDEQPVCQFLSEFLSEQGQNVTNAYSGSEAIKLLKSETFDLLLCDLIMPEKNGRDVIKVLDTLVKAPKVGLITGWSEKIEIKDMEDLKVDFILRKPFNFSELSRQINDLFNA
ncbi:MAG: hypothetical protein SCALA701_11420 [Candidatus Scalindua sp.]|nr:MAG: hypothetical protein SCALA701_11420 [Candidatus Scalindua sp.]